MKGLKAQVLRGWLIVGCVHGALQSRPADTAAINAADSSLCRLLCQCAAEKPSSKKLDFDTYFLKKKMFTFEERKSEV